MPTFATNSLNSLSRIFNFFNKSERADISDFVAPGGAFNKISIWADNSSIFSFVYFFKSSICFCKFASPFL